MTPQAPVTVRTTCPHNCYDTCGMIVTVEDGLLRQLEGDPDHPVTRGRLCAKGYSYADRMYAHDRLRHPMVQSPRGSGNWRRMTWDEALGLIATRLLTMYQRHGSLLPLCLYRGSGNIGALHEAPDALFRSIGPFTEAVNVLCWSAGMDAQRLDFGDNRTSDPVYLGQAQTLLLWGVNPAWTAPHQMSLIMEARERGTHVVVIDPVCTATASRADAHLALRPGTDGALALGMARVILDEHRYDEAFLQAHVKGWPEFAAYLTQEVTVDWAAEETGLPAETIQAVARLYASGGPAMIWLGFGMQRHQGAGQAIRAIDALAAITGQIGKPGTGVQYAQMKSMVFGQYLRSFDRYPDRPNRRVAMGATGRILPALDSPPVEMLWVTSGNPLCQEPDTGLLRDALSRIGTVVVVDQFLTSTAAMADIVLPTTTFLEQWDLVASYWHHHVTISQQAVAPCYEARSDLQIAWSLARHLNHLMPGSCRFPTDGDEREWVERSWRASGGSLFPGVSFAEAGQRPLRADLPVVAWSDRCFPTPSGRIELFSETAAARGLPALPRYEPPLRPSAAYPFRLLTPHSVESLHSQFNGSDWGLRTDAHPGVEMHPSLARTLAVSEGEWVRLYNERGELHLPVRVTGNVLPDTLVAYEAFFPGLDYNVNRLTEALPGPLEGEEGFAGVHYADCFVGVEPSVRRR